MKRFHVHLSVADLDDSIRFYTALFAAEPTVIKDDYAKWMLDDPRVNFAISQRAAQTGLDHLGFQVESETELADLNARLAAADLPSVEESGAACCYARSNKYWSVDPQGVAWEGFHSLSDIPTFNDADTAEESAAACCAPKTPVQQGCCS
ncbi:ArsI/CadI family heavy metal resistance metalloenzyme [Acidihalobacter ferrooxydans]|uniref:Glyoxalase/bleomycin resistance/dioxygenase family protein n=1 Tax=Acidihalobacter ferrooxydans TaxID=1765967 RepID=A0A1P8UDR4_9GAMM|nr:ArsI/CadI family heavy metal resistance metalloenzyme [Acidihalobacter ferrooxydans]APZ42002.1 glyoxalase/bleomycin resistance/dioxygenase family protein [Acidihalobacter ferrooxydans]